MGKCELFLFLTKVIIVVIFRKNLAKKQIITMNRNECKEAITNIIKGEGNQLDIREYNFIAEYLDDLSFNPERAAIKAGYSESTARVKSYKWVSNSDDNPKPYIKKIINKIIRSRLHDSEKMLERILEETANIAFFDIAELFPIMGPDGISLKEFKKLPKNVTCCIENINQTFDKNKKPIIKIKFFNKMKALEQLSKHLYIITEDEKRGTFRRSKIINKIRNGSTCEYDFTLRYMA